MIDKANSVVAKVLLPAAAAPTAATSATSASAVLKTVLMAEHITDVQAAGFSSAAAAQSQDPPFF